MNVLKKMKERKNNYGLLLRAMKLMYPEHKFTFVPIIVGALGSVPKEVNGCVRKLGFNKNKTNEIVWNKKLLQDQLKNVLIKND